MSATVFKHVFVNHRAVFEIGRESSEVAQDNEHEDTGGHHPSNLVIVIEILHITLTDGEEIDDKNADQYILVPHRPSLYESYDSIRHPEHYVRGNFEESGSGVLP